MYIGYKNKFFSYITCVYLFGICDNVTQGLHGPTHNVSVYQLMYEASFKSFANNKYTQEGNEELEENCVDPGVVMGGSWNVDTQILWENWTIPIVIVLLAAASITLLTLLILVLYKSQMLPRSKSESPPKTEWIFHPVVKPPVETCDGQPSTSSAPPAPAPPPAVEPKPVRVKAKGLLERRGSSASLTIDLHPSQENLTVVTPTKECSTQEFLLSAGNCLSREQLKNSLRDPKSLHSEFWDIPSNIPEKTELAGSGTKNRYKSILPNEHSRVKLPECKDDPLTGYINANYIRGFEGKEKAYIATQGPLPHTLYDFWSMMMSERVNCIVMITKLREKGRSKCEAYLPAVTGKCIPIYDITIEITEITQKPGYLIRDILIRQKSGMEYRIKHYWFTDWPDHKTPEDAGNLVAMTSEIFELPLTGPVVVHCSAGIGRTGCFIALATGMQQLKEQGKVDVLGIVCSLRQDRGGMVQTAEQYEFLHRALCLYESTLPSE